MNILVILIPIALMMGGIGLAAFLWSLRAEQYDDLEGASYRALFEEDEMNEEQNKHKSL